MALVASGLGTRLARWPDTKKMGWFALLVGQAMLLINLMTRQPHAG